MSPNDSTRLRKVELGMSELTGLVKGNLQRLIDLTTDHQNLLYGDKLKSGLKTDVELLKQSDNLRRWLVRMIGGLAFTVAGYLIAHFLS